MKATIYFGFSLREALHRSNRKIIKCFSKISTVEGNATVVWISIILSEPVDTIALPCRRRSIIEHVAKMSLTGCTKNFLTGHENNRQIPLRLHIVSYRLIIGGPSSSTVEFGGRPRSWCTRLRHKYETQVVG